jgi:hypothetical protein
MAYEALMKVNVKFMIMVYMTPCSLVNINQLVGGFCCFPLQGKIYPQKKVVGTSEIFVIFTLQHGVTFQMSVTSIK